MKQVWITRAGGPEVLELREAEDPSPGPGEVAIDVAASGINFADILARMGLYPDAPPLPCVVGYEVAGTVRAVGSGVQGLKQGDRVAAATRFGGYADVVVQPAEHVLPLPAQVSFEQGAALPVNYLTAWIMLEHLGHVKEGDTVLVHSAGGGVGIAALQIARWRGARVIGTASKGKHARLEEMGVEHCIDYRTEDFEARVLEITHGRGVDIALDPIGGKSLQKSYNVLGPLGRVFAFGVSTMATGKRRSIPAALSGLWNMPRFKPVPLMNDNRGVHGVNVGHLWDRQDLLRPMFERIVALLDEGTFDPVIAETFSFSRASEAHHYIQDRKNFGKVLLKP